MSRFHRFQTIEEKEKNLFTSQSSIHAPQPSCTPFSPRTHRQDPNFSPSERSASNLASQGHPGNPKKKGRRRLVRDPRDASPSPRTGRGGRHQVANSRHPPKIHQKGSWASKTFTTLTRTRVRFGLRRPVFSPSIPKVIMKIHSIPSCVKNARSKRWLVPRILNGLS